MTADGSRMAMSNAVNNGTSINQGLMTNVLSKPSANEAASTPLPGVWLKLATKKTVKVMANDGTVVMSMYRIWSNNGTSPTDEASTVVSESGEILSPK